MAAIQPAATQLEFHQAMADFKTMFPKMDDDVIEAVLRANQGAVDATIDQLLAMSTDNENERIRNELEQDERPPLVSLIPSPAATPISVSVSPPPHQPTGSLTPQRSPPSVGASPKPSTPHRSPTTPLSRNLDYPLRITRGWEPPLLLPLPEDFLRISSTQKGATQQRQQTLVLSQTLLQQKYVENQQKRVALTDGEPELARYLEDERIALFLQNEEFMQELKRNKDFLSTLEKDSYPTHSPRHWNGNDSDSDFSDTDDDQLNDAESPPEERMGTYPFSKTLSSHDDDAIFKERLKNMGKMSRKKFAQLARVFTRRKKRSAKQILTGGAAPSRDNLLLNAEPLLVDEDDSDETGSLPHTITSDADHSSQHRVF